MKTTDIEQLHSFWMTLWNFLLRFRYLLDSKETQKAMMALNQPIKHPFWKKLHEALGTLVRVPVEESSVRFLTRIAAPAVGTRELLTRLDAEISSAVAREIEAACRYLPAGVNCVRTVYDANDFRLLGAITHMFPGHATTPFSLNTSFYTLSLIHQFMCDSDGGITSGIVDPSASNVFLVPGKKGLVMLAVRKKLNTWHILKLSAGDNVPGTKVHFFT